MFIDNAENVIENDAQTYIDILYIYVLRECVYEARKKKSHSPDVYVDIEKSSVNFDEEENLCP